MAEIETSVEAGYRDAAIHLRRELYKVARSNNWDALFVLAREIKLFCGLLTRLPELFSPRYSLISLHGSGANLQRGASRSLFLVGLAPAFCAFLLSLPVRLAGL